MVETHKVVRVHTTSDPLLGTVDSPDNQFTRLGNETKTRQNFPHSLLTAEVFRPATSDPANASDMAKLIICDVSCGNIITAIAYFLSRKYFFQNL